jgi:hypothetical protein
MPSNSTRRGIPRSTTSQCAPSAIGSTTETALLLRRRSRGRAGECALASHLLRRSTRRTQHGVRRCLSASPAATASTTVCFRARIICTRADQRARRLRMLLSEKGDALICPSEIGHADSPMEDPVRTLLNALRPDPKHPPHARMRFDVNWSIRPVTLSDQRAMLTRRKRYTAAAYCGHVRLSHQCSRLKPSFSSMLHKRTLR